MRTGKKPKPPGKRQTKRERRESILPEGQAGRVLDKLLLLEQVIPPDQVQDVLRVTGCLDARRSLLTFEVTCWVVLAMGILTDRPIQMVFKAARRLYPNESTPHRSSLCRARQRLGVAPLRLLFQRLAKPFEIVDGRAQTDHSGNVGRASFKLRGQFGIARALLEAHGSDHVPASLIRRQLLQ